MENEDNLHLRNFTEILVDETLDRLWDEMGEICKCKRCRFDTKAIALNNLKPNYTVTEQGEIYTKLNNFRNQVQVDLIKEVLNATFIVKSRCSHYSN
ncbi:competence protein ComFB [Alkalibaculum sp. M08DMB]|uniref:Competence protein ComFB n=1 Tax=Alkalibaculum sporogenes TaxID=2655001 RepID=A0A6A7KDB3_9FIRM|nr:late competence development ComFB family protein [Alkalibaculum sporogenes]MPW27342.1 competence protein ComFB [Alkalibaculum sporogenes]